MKPLYIFDLDGTLALCDHRRPLLDDKSNPKRWVDFYRACVLDLPNKPIIEIFNKFIFDCNVYIFSGRSKIVLPETLRWLIEHTNFYGGSNKLFLREVEDSTPDQLLKKNWYYGLNKEDKDRLVCVFDDRQKVVDMWRSLGVTCCQVAKGDF